MHGEQYSHSSRMLALQLLADAATLAPSMTLEEFGAVYRIAAILFLGFLVPTSTGNDFFVNSERSGATQQAAGSRSSESASDADAFLNMSLEERLEKCCRLYSQGEFGEVNCCLDPTREKVFRSFLQNGIGLLLAARPAHPTETDLLHLVAMIISPQPQQALISRTAKALVEKDSLSWTRAKRLMACIHPRSFHVNYSHRLVMVQMMANRLVLPQSSATFADDALADGAVPHLRAALHSFAIGQSAIDAHEAHCALVNIAVRTGDETTVNEEWDALVKLTASDCTDCACEDTEETFEVNKRRFCAHSARGKLMKQFVLNYNESRHYADAAFTHRTLKSLSTCIQKSLTAQPCLIASLLMATRSLFYFLLPDAHAGNGEANDESNTTKDARDLLMRTAIQLLCHPQASVSKAASSLLALAFSYNSSELSVASIQGVEKSIQMALDPLFQISAKEGTKGEKHFQSLQHVIITLSRLSSNFASGMLEYLFQKLQQDVPANAAAFRMIATIATARPFAAHKHADSILSLTKSTQDVASKSQLAATLLALRQAHLFAKDGREDIRITTIISGMEDRWTRYKLACQALVTGNNLVAKDAFESILASSSSETSFLWISVLSNVASAEDELTSQGSHGILSATPPLYSAVSYLESLADTSGNSFGFQIEYLQLRIDFLEQCVSLYNLCREIRLSGTVPKATVRTGLHLRNNFKLFYALAGRYYSLYRRYGLFLCQQSRTALRTCNAMCRWLGDAGRTTLPEVTSKAEGKADDMTWPHGDELHPSTLLLKKLNKVVLEPMESSFDPQLRGAALAETLDAILMTPYPFPRGFTIVKSIPSALLRLSIDRSETDDAMNYAHDEEETLNVYPGGTCAIIASGEITMPAFQKADLPFSHVLLWHSDRCIRPVNVDDEALSEGGTGNEDSRQDSLGSVATGIEGGPLVSPLLPDGRYLTTIQYQAPVEEGIYTVEVTLGCRDIRCGEWDLPVEGNSNTMLVRVSRSR